MFCTYIISCHKVLNDINEYEFDGWERKEPLNRITDQSVSVGLLVESSFFPWDLQHNRPTAYLLSEKSRAFLSENPSFHLTKK